MRRILSALSVSGLLIVGMASPASAGTEFKATGIKVANQWVVGQTDLKLTEAPGDVLDDKANHVRYGVLDNAGDFAKLWKAWRKDEPPKVDFATQFVLVLAQPENAKVEFAAALDDAGNLALSGSSTERSPNGMTYVIAVIDRAGVKAVNGKPRKPAK
jgi:hypothetical protein